MKIEDGDLAEYFLSDNFPPSDEGPYPRFTPSPKGRYMVVAVASKKPPRKRWNKREAKRLATYLRKRTCAPVYILEIVEKL